MNKITEELLAAVKNVVGNENVITGEDIGADFCHDELAFADSFAPEAVIIAHSTQEISECVKLCAEACVALTVRGAGTGQAGGSVPVEGGVVISTAAMKEMSIDPDAKTITAQAGVLLQDIKAEAEKNSLYYPPDPGEKTATIGGNVATNAAGPCAVKYGTTKDYVLDAVVVKADGTIEKISENAALTSVVGSEGTLGIITEVTLKLIDKPGAEAILLFPFMDIETCLKAADTIMAQDFAPAVVELLDTDIVEFSGNVTGNPVFPVDMDGDRVGATLMVTLEAEDDDAVMEKMEVIAEMAEDLECLDILVGDTSSMIREFWTAHDAFHTSMESGAKSDIEVNITLPTDKLCEMITFAKELGEEKGAKVMTYAHVGSGGLHIHAASESSKDEYKSVAADITATLLNKCIELGGSVRGEYGIGYAKKDFYKSELGEEAFAALKATKTALDATGIMNPGKVYAE